MNKKITQSASMHNSKATRASSVKVSVVMATYNRADTLPRAIDSILAQTLSNFEFIIVDDGSTDNTSKLLQEYVKKDSRIKVITQKNQGHATSCNNGVALAKGMYITFMDSDDACAINRLELQVGFLERNADIHAVICEYSNIATEFYPDISGIIGTKVFINDADVYEARGIRGVLGGAATITKESFLALGGYRADMTIIDDLDFTLRYSVKYKWAFTKGASLYFYNHPLNQDTIGQSNANVLKFTKRHIACYISAWHVYKNLADPVAEGQALEDILKTARTITLKDKYIIFKSAGHLFENIAVTQKITINQAKTYVLNLLDLSAIVKHCILIWSATKDAIKSFR